MSKKIAKEVRQALKGIGYTNRQVSVSSPYHGTVDVRVKVKGLDYDKISNVCQEFHVVRRCKITHSVMSGGMNVFVGYCPALLDSYMMPIVKILRNADIGESLCFKGIPKVIVTKNGNDFFSVYDGGEAVLDGYCSGVSSKCVARKLLDAGMDPVSL